MSEHVEERAALDLARIAVAAADDGDSPRSSAWTDLARYFIANADALAALRSALTEAGVTPDAEGVRALVERKRMSWLAETEQARIRADERSRTERDIAAAIGATRAGARRSGEGAERMSERREWVKLWSRWYTTASHLEVGAAALHVGAVLMTLVRWTPGDSDDAWAEFDGGQPMPVAAIAARAQMGVGECAEALAKLESRGTVMRRPDGAWGFARFGAAQESADAARKRAQRAHVVRGMSAAIPREVEAEAEAELDRVLAKLDAMEAEPEPAAPGKEPNG